MKLVGQSNYNTPYTFTTIVGSVSGSAGSNDGTGIAANVYTPTHGALDSAGNLYITDTLNYTVRKITRDGVTTTIAGAPGDSRHIDGARNTARFVRPYGIAIDSGDNIYVSDQYTIRKITTQGVVTTFAGTGSQGAFDGVGTNAQFNWIGDIVINNSGDIFATDQFNHTIRKIASSGVVTTIAGSAGNTGSTDGTGNAARFNRPSGITIDSGGDLYVSDFNNHTIRRVTKSGAVSTFAGVATVSGSVDGPANIARFYNPSGLSIDASGTLYIADNRNCTIRKIAPDGVASTIAGQVNNPSAQDGTGSHARFYFPTGVVASNSGTVYVIHANSIRAGSIAAPTYSGSLTASGSVAQAFSFLPVFSGAPTSYSATGLPTGLNVNASTGQISGTPTTVGTFSVNIGAANGGGTNSATVSIAIGKATAQVTFSNQSQTYDGTAKSVTATTTPSGLPVSITYNGSTTAPTNAGTYAVAGTISDTTYQGVVTSTLTIAKKVVTVSADNKTRAVGEPNPTLTATFTGFVNGETRSVVTGTPTLSSTAALNSLAGSYPITISPGSLNAANYSFTFISGTLTVAAIAPTITSQPASANVNIGQNATFKVVASGESSQTFQWRKDGVPLAGETTATLRVSNVTTATAGAYTVAITNAVGTTISAPAVLTVNAPITLTSQPTGQSAALGARVTFSVTATSAQGTTLNFQWRRDGVNLTGATEPNLTLASVTDVDFGTYTVLITSSAGSAVSSPAALSRATEAGAAPVITRQPQGATINAGGTLVLTVAASGSPAPSYQWQFKGVPLSGATTATLVLTDVLAAQAGAYTVVVTNSSGSVTSSAANLAVAAGFGRQLNVSTLGFVGTGGDLLIPGFVIAGSGAKRLLIRAVGPSLAVFGVPDLLADPKLAIFSGSTQVLSNDNWSTDAFNATAARIAASSVGAFPLTEGSKDAALVATLNPGGYSIQVSGVGSTTGKALVELYDLDAADPTRSRLVNLATRALVTAGGGPLISGFVVQGAVAKAVLVRATGPALAAFGVPGALARPKLTLFDNSGSVVAANTGWESAGISDAIIAASQSVGAFPLSRGSMDSVVLAVLAPGSYTVQVVGADAGGGVALIEVYELP